MYSIIEISTGRLIVSSAFDVVDEGQIAIEDVCTIEGEGDKYYNFQTGKFYTHDTSSTLDA
jgi:hypothetical protein